MQIRSIELEGLWSYRDQQQIVIGGHPLVVGVGENGAGKSALLVASVVAAFYGKFPTKTIEESITTGAPQGRVSVEFDVDGNLYRISRTYPRTGAASAQVLISDPSTRSGWRAVTEKGQKEVNEYIVNLLGMDYDTATMTWVAEQGSYGKFSNALPSKRFELLSSIFGLDIYGPKAAAAAAAAKLAVLEVAKADGAISELTGTMDTVDGQDFGFGAMSDQQLTQNLADATDDVDRYTQQIAELNATDPARQTVEARQAYELVRNDRTARLHAATQQVSRSELTIGQAKNRANTTRRAAEEAFNRALESAATRAQNAKEQATRARRQASEKKLEIASAGRDLPPLIDEVTAAREQADDFRRAADEAVHRAAEHRSKHAGFKGQFTAVKQKIVDAESRILLLTKSAADAEHAECFACGQHLSAADAEALIASQHRDIASWNEEILRLRELGSAETAAAEQLDAQRNALMVQARDSDIEADQIGGKIAALQGLIGTRDQVEASEQAAADALKQASADEETWRRDAAAAHTAAISAADADEEATVAQAEADLIAARIEVTATEEPSEKEKSLLTDLRAAEAVVEGEAAGFELRRQTLESQRAEARRLSTVYSAEANRRADAAVLRDAQESRLASLRVEKAEAERTVLVNQTLQKAFSPSGIPAMVLNTVVAELNDAVNVSLERLSRGELRVELRTSRETTKGTPDNKISVYVETGTGVRAYETLSGGQKFRVDLAIRTGLAAAIARGTGTPIRSFILDEGWGTLDEKGVMSTIETLFRLSEDTNVITVSHIDSVRDAFPARVEVSMSGGTSVAQLAA